MVDRALRIGVDGRELTGRATGVGRYISEVLAAWTADPAFPHRLTIFTPTDPPPTLTARLGPRAAWVVTGGRGTVWEQWTLPRATRRQALDVFFAGAYTAPILLGCPSVIALHDVSYFAHPEWFGWREGLRRRWLTRLSARRAHAILTLSAFSAQEILAHLGLPPARVQVVPAGAPPARETDGAGAASATVLYVGSLFNRRSIPDLIAGFADAAAHVPAARLILVGENRTHPHVDPRQVAADLGVRDRVDWRDYVTDAELDTLYATARVFAFLSSYEGFALTPFEAMAHGVPPVLLDTPVAREVYAEAAWFVPRDRGAIAHALRTLLEDATAHRTLVEAGHARLAQFSWTRTAAAVRTALERAAGARR